MKKLAINSFLAATALAWLSPTSANEASPSIGASGKLPSAEHGDVSTSFSADKNRTLMDGLCAFPPREK